ncbi:hypothetical protein BG004_002938 [Podila humilis]|nr:hypothetical protein BG004_002938 [Podila humilis]
MISRRKKLSRTISIPVTATVDQVVAALRHISLHENEAQPQPANTPEATAAASILNDSVPSSSATIPPTIATTTTTTTTTTTAVIIEPMPTAIADNLEPNVSTATTLHYPATPCHVHNLDPKTAILEILQKHSRSLGHPIPPTQDPVVFTSSQSPSSPATMSSSTSSSSLNKQHRSQEEANNNSQHPQQQQEQHSSVRSQIPVTLASLLEQVVGAPLEIPRRSTPFEIHTITTTATVSRPSFLNVERSSSSNDIHDHVQVDSSDSVWVSEETNNLNLTQHTYSTTAMDPVSDNQTVPSLGSEKDEAKDEEEGEYDHYEGHDHSKTHVKNDQDKKDGFDKDKATLGVNSCDDFSLSPFEDKAEMVNDHTSMRDSRKRDDYDDDESFDAEETMSREVEQEGVAEETPLHSDSDYDDEVNSHTDEDDVASDNVLDGLALSMPKEIPDSEDNEVSSSESDHEDKEEESGSSHYPFENTDTRNGHGDPQLYAKEMANRGWNESRQSTTDSIVYNDASLSATVAVAAPDPTPLTPQLPLPLPQAWDMIDSKQSLQEHYSAMDPYIYIHTYRHLEPVTPQDPLVVIRLVFQARELPRSSGFARLMAPIRQRHMVDTYLIPHESKPVVYPDEDVVLGFAGTLDRVLLALRDFLQELVWKPQKVASSSTSHSTTMALLSSSTLTSTSKSTLSSPSSSPSSTMPLQRLFHMWQLSELDNDLIYDEEQDIAESSVPQLRKCLGRRYGPVSAEASEEHILTLESTSLDNVLDALRFVGENMILDEKFFGPPAPGFYQGGRPSMIPEGLRTYAEELRQASLNMHWGVPVGYIIRPEMQPCLARMQWRRYHLQLILTQGQSVHVIGKQGRRIQHLQDTTGAVMGLSTSRSNPTRVCDVGANDFRTIINAVGGMVEMLSVKMSPFMIDSSTTTTAAATTTSTTTTIPSTTRTNCGWEVGVYVPQRVALVLNDESTRQSLMEEAQVDVELLRLQDAELQVREPKIRLEPTEVEWVAMFRSEDKLAGIESAISTVLGIMYKDTE